MNNINDTINEIKENKNIFFEEKINEYKNNEKLSESIIELEKYFNINISEDNLIKLNKYKNVKISSSFLAGFIDGDGHIYIHKQFSDEMKDKLNNIKQIYRYGINIGQARTNILQIIKYYFYGNIYKSTEGENINIDENGEQNKNNTRQIYIYSVNSYFSDYLIDYIYDSLVIKRQQIDTIYNYNYYNNEHEFNITENKDKILENICNENIKLHNVKNPEEYDYNFNNINIEYIAGLFDSEGCISLVAPFGDKYYSPKISISQKNHLIVLEKIIEYLGFGNIENNNSFTISGIKAYELINRIINFTIVKYNQLYVVKIFCENKNNLDDLEYLFLVDFVKKILNKEKHESENYIDDKNVNIDGFLEIVDDDLIKVIDNKKIIKSTNELRSEKMKGENNHNFGKHFSNVHKLNLGKSIALSKRKEVLSDENIEFVLNNGTLAPSDIIKDFKLKGLEFRHEYIRKIRNGKIRTIENYDKIPIKSEKEDYFENLEPNKKTSIGKRKIKDFNILIDIIIWKKSVHSFYKDTRDKTDNYKNLMNWNKNKVLNQKENKKLLGIPLLVDYLNENYNYNVTFFIIKNLWDGSSELFKEEFDYYNPENLTYDEYKEIIKK